MPEAGLQTRMSRKARTEIRYEFSSVCYVFSKNSINKNSSIDKTFVQGKNIEI